MTVIYSNFGDIDTRVLPGIWKNIPNVNVVEITRKDEDFEERVNTAVSQETETILMCGHGTTQGLLHPDLQSGQYIIHEENCSLIHAKNVIGFWCYASDFAKVHKLDGFYTSMYISNLYEAYQNGFPTAKENEIDVSIKLFVERLNGLLRASIPMDEWIQRLQVHMDPESEIESFNYLGLSYFNNRK